MCAVTAADPQAAISWYQDGVLIEGETMATVDITLTVEENGATVECRADNGLVRSSSVVLDLERKRWLGRTPMSMTLRRKNCHRKSNRLKSPHFVYDYCYLID